MKIDEKNKGDYLNHAKHFILGLSPLPEEEFRDFAKSIETKIYAPEEFFTKIEDTHDRVGFVVQGVFRVYYISPEGDYHVRNFCIEGMPIGSYATILTHQPAHVNIEALEKSVVLQFSYSELSKRFSKHPGWEHLGRRLAESHYISRERREYTFLACDASERYERFLQEFPGLDARISQSNIASYIGVTPETLSRIIKKRPT